MASKIFCVKNDAGGYTFRCTLFAQTGNQVKSNPTLASGDWTISKDGGAFANLATLPDVDPNSTYQVKIVLSQAETNADEIVIVGDDASGAEWHSVTFVIHTVAAGYDSLSTLTAAQVNTEADAALADAGVTTTVTGRIDAAVSSRMATFTPATPLDAAGTRTALGLASANLDTQLADLPTNAELATALGTADDAVLAAITALNNITAANVVTALEAATIDGTITRLQKERIELAVLAGKATVAGTTVTYRDAADTKARVTATVDDTGNRTSVTLDGA